MDGFEVWILIDFYVYMIRQRWSGQKWTVNIWRDATKPLQKRTGDCRKIFNSWGLWKWRIQAFYMHLPATTLSICVFLNGSQHSKFEFAFAFSFPANLQNLNFHFPPNIQNLNSNFQFPCFRTFKIRGECSESLSPTNFSSMRFWRWKIQFGTSQPPRWRISRRFMTPNVFGKTEKAAGINIFEVEVSHLCHSPKSPILEVNNTFQRL